MKCRDDGVGGNNYGGGVGGGSSSSHHHHLHHIMGAGGYNMQLDPRMLAQR